jgi:hypothetical protein
MTPDRAAEAPVGISLMFTTYSFECAYSGWLRRIPDGKERAIRAVEFDLVIQLMKGIIAEPPPETPAIEAASAIESALEKANPKDPSW